MTRLSSALRGRLVLPDGVHAGIVTVSDGRIRDVTPGARSSLAPGGVEEFDDDHLILPGLVDLHCHGANGAEFGVGADAARTAAAHHLARGTTTLVASLVSNTPENLVAGVRDCAPLVAEGVLAGLHLEGPFLSHARRGAQNPDVLTDADPALVDALVQAATDAGVPDAIVQWTFAPERDPAGTLPAHLAQRDILPAVGHTDAGAGATRAALATCAEVSAGVRGGHPLVTHLFNGMPSMHHRVPGPVASCLAAAGQGRAVVEVIADGQHLDAQTIRFLFDLLPPESIALITDAMAACGKADGSYSLGGQEVRVSGGAARLGADGSLAGSIATLAECVRFCVQQAGVEIHEAVRAASATPAAVLGRAGHIGAIAPGQDADLVVVDGDLRVVRVMRAGAWV